MKSTGEVMGIAADFPTAFGKAQAAAGVLLPTEGAVFITVTDTDKPAATQLAARFHDLGFEVIATGGTAQAISAMGVPVTPDQQDRRGLAARRRPDPRAPLRPGDQHPDRLRRPRRRLRDPHRRGPPRHPLRDDDDRRLRRGAGDRRRQARASAEVRSLQEIHGAGRRAAAGLDDAPRSGAGSARSPRTAPPAATGSSRCSTRRGPSRCRASSTCSPPSATGSRAASGPFLPRALSVAEAEPGGGGVRLDFLIEGDRPRHRPALRARARGRGSGSTARSATPSRRRASSAPGAAGAILVGGGIGIAPLALLRRRFAEPRRPDPGPARLPRPSPLRRPRRPLLAAARSASPARTATSATAATSPTCSRRCSTGDDAGQRRRLRLRPAGDAGGGARALRRARGRLRAGDGVADGLRLRRLLRLRRAASRDGGYLRLCVDGPVVRGERIAEVAACLSSAGSSSRTR